MLDEKTRSLAEAKSFAVLSTLMRDGQPQTQTMWVDTDGEHIILNTEIDRAKYRNIERDPRVTVLIPEAGNPWSYSEVRGRVVETVRGPEARAHIDKMAKKYLGEDTYPWRGPNEKRVIYRIRPEHITTMG